MPTFICFVFFFCTEGAEISMSIYGEDTSIENNVKCGMIRVNGEAKKYKHLNKFLVQVNTYLKG